VALREDDQVSSGGNHALQIDIAALPDFRHFIKAVNDFFIEPASHRFVAKTNQVFSSAAKHDRGVEGRVVSANQFCGRVLKGNFTANYINNRDRFNRRFSGNLFGRFLGGFHNGWLGWSERWFGRGGGFSSRCLDDTSADQKHDSQQ